MNGLWYLGGKPINIKLNKEVLPCLESNTCPFCKKEAIEKGAILVHQSYPFHSEKKYIYGGTRTKTIYDTQGLYIPCCNHCIKRTKWKLKYKGWFGLGFFYIFLIGSFLVFKDNISTPNLLIWVLSLFTFIVLLSLILAREPFKDPTLYILENHKNYNKLGLLEDDKSIPKFVYDRKVLEIVPKLSYTYL